MWPLIMLQDLQMISNNDYIIPSYSSEPDY
jgi:hypothetical protein